ncbi:hypothetical protein Ciccas_000079 [Cichlidogyrus casuarinus]|uniref:Uncharacterized protein n=1 Tax=Cichlidogyrus casuarinus TaxID=1844966 RepID=A0ABD2QP71_9PLAT
MLARGCTVVSSKRDIRADERAGDKTGHRCAVAYLVNYREGDPDHLRWYRSLYATQHTHNADSSCPPATLLYTSRRSPQVQFSQELTPIAKAKQVKNSSAMESGKASLMPFTVKRMTDVATLDAKDMFASGRQVNLLDETQSSSNSSQGNDDSGVQITNNVESGFIQFKSGVEGSFV